MADYSESLTQKLDEALTLLNKGETVVFLFDDMADVNEHFQATLDYFKDRGNKMRRRYGNGAFMKSGVAYFVGADTYRPTNGVPSSRSTPCI